MLKEIRYNQKCKKIKLIWKRPVLFFRECLGINNEANTM